MFRKKYICILFLCIISLFFTLIVYFIYIVNNDNQVIEVRITTQYSIEVIEHEINMKALKLPEKYLRKEFITDSIIRNFQGDVSFKNKTQNFTKLWHEFDEHVKRNQNFSSNDIGNIIYALKTAKILNADLYSKGTQLKLIVLLEGNHLAVFKPQWYNKEKIILGNVYAGKDRIGSEILAFYLAGILNLHSVPVVTRRSFNIINEILPVASTFLNKTKFKYRNNTCIYGACLYCKKEDPICTSENGQIDGAIIFHIPGKLHSYNSPWQRTYKKGKRAVWETVNNYCDKIKLKIQKTRLLDLIDVSIFDFLIQNGDRHHYEVLINKVILLDNGKGLGNPYIHHLDILAPLYQCCILRRSTWNRLKILSGGLLSEILESFLEVKNVVWGPHLIAMDERLKLIYAAVENCVSHERFQLY